MLAVDPVYSYHEIDRSLLVAVMVDGMCLLRRDNTAFRRPGEEDNNQTLDNLM